MVRSTAMQRRPEAVPAPRRDRRQAIIEAAARVFFERGYGAASMDAIARTARVSKQTIYTYFGTKAGLFDATILNQCDWLLEPSLPREDDAEQDPAAVMEAIARRFLGIVLSPTAAARMRVIIAERGRNPELADIFFRAGPGRATAGLAHYLARMHQERRLFVPDAHLAASQFFGMIRGDVFLRHVLGLEPGPSRLHLERIVRSAVEIFLLAHKPRDFG